MQGLLGELTDSVAQASSLEELTRPLLELLETVLGMESTYLTRVEPDGGTQRILFARNTSTLSIPEGLAVPWEETLCRRALESGPMATDDVPGTWGDSRAAAALGITSYASSAVRDPSGGLLGTLCAASTERKPLPPNGGEVLRLFALLLGQFMERERLIAELEVANRQLASQAMLDPLTGLPNRRALMLELGRALARREREGQRLLVGFVDLDGFKTVNDTRGHEVGDQLLVAVGRALTSALRAGDFVARPGGDEFVVLVAAAADATGASVDALRARLEDHTALSLPLPGGDTLRYPGASVGVVLTEVGDRDPEAVLAAADAAMYEAKRRRQAGR